MERINHNFSCLSGFSLHFFKGIKLYLVFPTGWAAGYSSLLYFNFLSKLDSESNYSRLFIIRDYSSKPRCWLLEYCISLCAEHISYDRGSLLLLAFELTYSNTFWFWFWAVCYTLSSWFWFQEDKVTVE